MFLSETNHDFSLSCKFAKINPCEKFKISLFARAKLNIMQELIIQIIDYYPVHQYVSRGAFLCSYTGYKHKNCWVTHSCHYYDNTISKRNHWALLT